LTLFNVVTLRTYSNPAEAALAKSLLDDHNIVCSLADENAYFYGGAPFAMPVRIVVADEQAEEADRVLKNADRSFAGFNSTPDGGVQETIETVGQERPPGREHQLAVQSLAKNNPWEILVIAALLLVPSLGLLLQKHGLILAAWRSGRISRTETIIVSPATAHVLGALGVAGAFLLTILFFYIRGEIKRDQIAVLRDQAM
jgi:Putative prokaryotic signal transducing protein